MKKITPIRAIRLKCLDCCNGSQTEVKLCPITDCPLYAYRLGKDPARRGITHKGSFRKKTTVQSVSSGQEMAL